jgi:hypothetical protein
MLSGAPAGVLWLIVGLVLGWLGAALMSNHRNMRDRYLEVDRRRYRMYRGTSLFPPSKESVERTGVILFGLGVAFVVAGVSQF